MPFLELNQKTAEMYCAKMSLFLIWPDINNIFQVKSKEEFVQAFSQVKLSRENLIPIVQQSMNCNAQEYVDELHAFHNLGKIFADFGNEIEEKGFYNAISNTVPKLIHAYLETGKAYTGKKTYEPSNAIFAVLWQFIPYCGKYGAYYCRYHGKSVHCAAVSSGNAGEDG